MSELAERLAEEFKDKDYAHAYLEEHGNLVLAAQIKVLREMRGLTQRQLADLAGMKQERISALENVDYDAWTVKTLRKLAKAFDTGLEVSFVPCSRAIMSVVNVSAERLQVPARADDLKAFQKHKIVSSGGQWRAIDGNHLATVQPFSTSRPIDPQAQKNWLRFEKAEGAMMTAVGG